MPTAVRWCIAVLVLAGCSTVTAWAGGPPAIGVTTESTTVAIAPTTTAATVVVPPPVRPAPSLDDAARRVEAISRVSVSDDPPVVPISRIADVAYGPEPEQVLDVLRSSGPSRHDGAIVYVHGGAWVGGDKDISTTPYARIIEHLVTDEGWTVFSIDYRLAPNPDDALPKGTPFPAALLDVNRAVRWVKAHAMEFGVSPANVVVYGHSAGGHLAALIGTAWNEPSLQPVDLPANLAAVSSRPAAVVSLSGPLDPAGWGDSNPDPTNQFSGTRAIAAFGGCTDLLYTSCTPAQLRALDVSTYADANDPPMYITHGDVDAIVRAAEQQPVVLRLMAALPVGYVWYDLVTDGPPDERNHVLDRSVNTAALQAFLRLAVPDLSATSGRLVP
jgi:acetyl esterase/lipase